jgi:hypothetical protein
MKDDKNPRNAILMAMYRSVERMNCHWTTGNNQGVIAERWLQTNLRKNFKEISKNVE